METIVIFDFDCTIIDVDSDPWVAEQLGLSHIFDKLRAQMPWNDMMEAFLGELHKEGKTVAEVEDALRSAPLHSPKISAIQQAHALGCELHIVSDANTFFIKTILDKYGLTKLFSEIHTNPASIDEDGRIHIKPFHPKSDPPHNCSLCPPNMCKGRIIQDILNKNVTKRIIYLGDGCGDYCPSLRLRSWDYVLPREGFPLFELLTKNLTIVKPSVYPWNTPSDMEDILLNIINTKHVVDEHHSYVGTIGVNCTTSALPLGDQSNEIVSITSVKA